MVVDCGLCNTQAKPLLKLFVLFSRDTDITLEVLQEITTNAALKKLTS